MQAVAYTDEMRAAVDRQRRSSRDVALVAALDLLPVLVMENRHLRAELAARPPAPVRISDPARVKAQAKMRMRAYRQRKREAQRAARRGEVEL